MTTIQTQPVTVESVRRAILRDKPGAWMADEKWLDRYGVTSIQANEDGDIWVNVRGSYTPAIDRMIKAAGFSCTATDHRSFYTGVLVDGGTPS